MTDSKQVIVLRTDLNMRKGKMCAQAAHASMKVFLDQALTFIPEKPAERPCISGMPLENKLACQWLGIPLDERTTPWLFGSYTKVVVGTDSEASLLEIHEKAKKAGLLTALVQDLGKTEFGGVPTYTSVAVGPDAPEKIDAITGALGLL